MAELLDTLKYFHFIRPLWLLLLPVTAWLWWQIRTQAAASARPPEALAPHLANALTVGSDSQRKLKPIDSVALIILLASLAAAGPTWSRKPNPLVSPNAPLAIVLAVSESMLSPDIAPSRLERAKQKILDLLGTRTGARTALIAYAGSAHRVVPLTEDPAIFKPFLEGLKPDIMPSAGRQADQALLLANQVLSDETVPGAILFILDTLNNTALAAFQEHYDNRGARLVLLAVSRSEADLDTLDDVPGADRVLITPDGEDITRIERLIASAYRDALANDERLAWDDKGYLPAGLAAILVLLWFRRGWTMRWSIVLCIGLSSWIAPPVYAEDDLTQWFISYFLTPDQQGRLAFEQLEFAQAAEHFQDPQWRGYALYKNGKYAEAAQIFAQLPGADAAFARGMAHIKAREYRPAINAFKLALERDPGHQDAAQNLPIAEAILAYVEQARETSDTGTGSEGADDIAFDKESEGGTRIEITEQMQSKIDTAEQWMRSVETQTSDFLRIRFATEAGRSEP